MENSKASLNFDVFESVIKFISISMYFFDLITQDAHYARAWSGKFLGAAKRRQFFLKNGREMKKKRISEASG